MSKKQQLASFLKDFGTFICILHIKLKIYIFSQRIIYATSTSNEEVSTFEESLCKIVTSNMMERVAFPFFELDTKF